MPLSKSKGNMYNFVTHCHTHLSGRCPHECSYCFVQAMGDKFPAVKAKYSGPVRLIEGEFKVNYGSGKIIFIEHMNDLFAIGVRGSFISAILGHCALYPENEYVFQTRNTPRAFLHRPEFPRNFMIGTTIESNRTYQKITKAPTPMDRYAGLLCFGMDIKTFVTIEPILDFDVDVLVEWIFTLNPTFVNIGADSKHCKLPEPSDDKIRALVAGLQERGITIKKKINLGRIFK